jgi:hypothetical protein
LLASGQNEKVRNNSSYTKHPEGLTVEGIVAGEKGHKAKTGSQMARRGLS